MLLFTYIIKYIDVQIVVIIEPACVCVCVLGGLYSPCYGPARSRRLTSKQRVFFNLQ